MGLKGLRVVLLALALLVSMIPPGEAVSCSLRFQSVDYPAAVDLGQRFQVVSRVNVTCSQSKIAIVGRVDIVEAAPGVILSSSSFRIGYFGGLDGGTRNATAVNNLVAPPLAANWTIQVRATLYTSVFSIGGSQMTPFTIVVGRASLRETLQTVPVLVNGGFEDGLDGWTIEKNYGFLAVTSKVARNGSYALRLDMPYRMRHRVEGSAFAGVSQTIYINNLRSLRVRGWVMDGCYSPWLVSCSLQGNGRLRVDVGAFTKTYGFSDCSSWCLIDRNVTEDLKPRLTLAQYASILHSEAPVPVTISLELLIADSYFVVFLDDVQVDAGIPVGSAPSGSQSLDTGIVSPGVPVESAHLVVASTWSSKGSSFLFEDRTTRCGV